MGTHFIRANGAPLSWETAANIAAAVDAFDYGKVVPVHERPFRLTAGGGNTRIRDPRRLAFADYIRETLGYHKLMPALNEARKIRRQLAILKAKQAA